MKKALSKPICMGIGFATAIVLMLIIGIFIGNIPSMLAAWLPLGFGFGLLFHQKFGDSSEIRTSKLTNKQSKIIAILILLIILILLVTLYFVEKAS